MANNISPGTVWELRPDGSSLNGGGFDSTYGGTDYSQQLAAQLTLTDLSSSGGTTYTSAAGGFTAAMVGNVINYCVDGVNQVPVTITGFTDSHTITGFIGYGGAFSNKPARVGGAMTVATHGFDPMGMLVPFNSFDGIKLWVRDTNSDGTAGHYANSSATNLNFGGSASRPFCIEGYSTTRGDGGMFQLTMTSNYLTISASYSILKNAHIVGVSGWSCGISVTGSFNLVDNVQIDPHANSSAADFLDVSGSDNTFRRVVLKASAKDIWAVSYANVRNTFEHCDLGSVAASTSGHAIAMNGFAEFYHCIFRDCSGHGIFANNTGASGRFHNCVFWNNTGDNFHLSNAAQSVMSFTFEDCIFGKAGAYDLNYTPEDLSANAHTAEWAKANLRGNWFFTTGTARYHNLPAGSDDTVLTGDPFVNAAGGNFALNPASAAGAAVIANPRAVVLSDGSTSYITAGAISPSSAPVAIVVAAAVAGVAPSIDEVQFPTGISEGATGGPAFATVVVIAGNGLEQRVPLYQHGRYKWNAGPGMKSPSDMATVMAFFLARQGKTRGFRWKDWDDFTATAEALTISGGPTAQLTKTYTSGLVSYARVIYKPVASPAITIQRGGGAYSAWTVDTTSGIVTWTPIIQKSVTGITQASSAVLTVGASHGFVVGDVVYIAGVVGMTQINALTGTVSATASTTVTVSINSSAFTAYSSGGTCSKYPQPSDVVTWSGQFDVPVRFDTDEAMMTQEAATYRNWTSLPVIELTGG